MYKHKHTTNGGRKGKYTPDMADRAYKLCLLGLTDKELSYAFGVNVATIDYWKAHKPVFLDAVRRGRLEADAKVAEALYQRAIGYSCIDTHITTAYNRAEKRVEIIKTPIIKQYPPEAWAALKWLTIRQRDKWADVKQVQHTFAAEYAENIVEQLSDENQFSDSELELMLKMGLQQAVQLNKVNEN